VPLGFWAVVLNEGHGDFDRDLGMLVEAVGNIQKLEMKQDASAVRLREDWQGWVLQPGTLAFV
ncbi:unnamed protein product, partial [Effrenium voratum]